MFWGLPSRVPKERRSQEVISAQHCYSLLLATDHPPHHSKYNSSHESELDCQKCRKRYSGEWGGCRRTKASHTALNELSVADKWGGCGGRGENILETENDNLYLAVGAVRRKPLCGKFREDPGSSGMGAGFQRAITCFIWSQNPGEKPGKYAPKMALAAAMQRAFSGERNGARPAPANSAPCYERGAHGARCPGKAGVQEVARQGRSRGATSEWPEKSRRLSRPYAVVSFRLHPEQRALTGRGKAIPGVHDVGDKLPGHRKGEGLLRRLGVEGVQQLGAHPDEEKYLGAMPLPAHQSAASTRISRWTTPLASRLPQAMREAAPGSSYSPQRRSRTSWYKAAWTIVRLEPSPGFPEQRAGGQEIPPEAYPVLRKNSIHRQAARGTRKYSWWSPFRTGLETTLRTVSNSMSSVL